MSRRDRFRISAAAAAVLALGALASVAFFDGSNGGSGTARAAAASGTLPNAVVAPPGGGAPSQLNPVVANPSAARPPAAAAPAAGRAATAPNAAVATPAPAAAAGASGAAAPRIIVIDRNFILQRSAAGRDMLAQVQNLTRQAETQFKNEETQLVTEAGQLQQQLAILAPEVRSQKEREFNAKQQAFQTRVTQRQAEIQAGFNKAAREIEVALEPILRAIMVERGANMVVDRSAVILSTVDIDVTPDAVQRLDRALPRVRVELTPVPAGAAQAAAGRGAPPAVPTPAAASGRR